MVYELAENNTIFDAVQLYAAIDKKEKNYFVKSKNIVYSNHNFDKNTSSRVKTMSAFLVTIGFLFSVCGMIFSPHIFHNLIKNTQERKIISFISMLPGIVILSLGFYLS